MKKTYHGSCHCGAVRFEADLDLAAGTNRCNCSFCTKARMWFTFAREGEFRLLAGEDALADYQHTKSPTGEAFLHFQFCRHCGVRGFTRGGYLEAFGGTFHAVNLGCLDDATDEELAAAPVRYADGRHDQWDREAAFRYL